MAKVFISYRRTDSAAISGRIYDHLVATFRRKNVFKDVDNIPAGVNFGAYIQDSLRACGVMLVVIGPTWLDARAPDGSRRLNDPHDWVRVEIETALALKLTIIPLLVEDASIPHAMDLPESLREIPALNALPVRNDPDFAHDMERVIAAVERTFASRPTPGFAGIFRRGVPSLPVDSESSTPFAPPTPARSDHPAAVPQVMPETGAGEHPVVAGKLPQSPGQTRGWRILLAAVATVLIVASLGVLLSQNMLHLGAGGNVLLRPTSTATVPATARVTQTSPVSFPLLVSVPGPGNDCADASHTEALEVGWLAVTGLDDIDCSNGRTTRLIPGACNGCGAYQGEYAFSISDARVDLPDTYAVSVQVSRLTAGTEAHFFLMNAHWENLYDIGAYHASNAASYRTSASLCPDCQAASGFFDTNKINTLAFHVAGDTITVLLNGKEVGSQTLATPPKVALVGFGVSITQPGTGYTGNPYHVDFSNFSISAP